MRVRHLIVAAAVGGTRSATCTDAELQALAQGDTRYRHCALGAPARSN